MEGWPQRIARVLHPVGLATGLAQARVIQGGNQWLPGIQPSTQGLAHGREQLFGFDPFRRVHSIVGAPIAKQPSGCSKHSGQGMPSQAEQLAEQMPAYTLAHRLGAKALALVQEFFDAREERRGVFFTVIGEGGT